MKNILFYLIFMFSSVLFAQSDKEYFIIGATDVNLREKPDSKSALIAKLQIGELGEILDKTETPVFVPGTAADEHCGKFFWYKVKIGGKSGWVFGAFLFHLSEPNFIARDMNSQASDLFVAFQHAAGGDMCVGENFIVVSQGAIEEQKKLIPVKVVGLSGFNGYKGFLELDFMMMPQIAFEKNSKIYLSTGGYAPGDFAEITVWELSYNKSEDVYEARQKYTVSR